MNDGPFTFDGASLLSLKLIMLNITIPSLEGMYSLFAGASSRQTYTVCETRGGITGVTPCLPSVWLARLAVIDDQIRDEELHLLRLVPLVWLRTDHPMRFENIPTEFGPVSLTAQLVPPTVENSR